MCFIFVIFFQVMIFLSELCCAQNLLYFLTHILMGNQKNVNRQIFQIFDR